MSVPTTHHLPVAEIPLPRLPTGKIDVSAWAEQLGVKPIRDINELSGGVWPEDESVDDFLAARREWRTEGTPKSGEP